MIGAAPNYDCDPAGQISRVFEIARDFDVDIDMHLDSGHTAERLDTLLVASSPRNTAWRGAWRSATSPSSPVPPADMEAVAHAWREAGVALTVLPSTDCS